MGDSLALVGRDHVKNLTRIGRTEEHIGGGGTLADRCLIHSEACIACDGQRVVSWILL